MDESKTPAQTPGASENAYQDSPLIHRICEACNNMFPVHASDPTHRCPKCRK